MKNKLCIGMVVILLAVATACKNDDSAPVLADAKNSKLELITINADFSAREGHAVVSFKEKLWLVGGDNTSEVWNSDDGKNWHQISANGEFNGRSEHTLSVFNDTLWLIGGRDTKSSEIFGDVWYSIDGEKWNLANPKPFDAPRSNHATIVFDGRLFVTGGANGSGVGNYTNEIWCSRNGFDWFKMPVSNIFSSRYDHTALAFEDAIWVIGGNDGFGGYGGSYKNDVWRSTDGINWDRVADSVSFSERGYHASIVFNEKMWIIGGYDTSDSFKNDLWFSEDGELWEKFDEVPSFGIRRNHTAVVHDNKSWIIAGRYDSFGDALTNDVWQLE